MLQAIGLTSTPRRKLPPLVDGLSFEARPGCVTALLGDPGSGRTTALRLMLELEPGRGITYFRGRPLHRIPHPGREVGVLLGDVPGHPARTVRNQLRMLCAAAGVPASRAETMMEVVGIAGLRDERLGSLSLGMDRRVGLAAALLADPCTLLLDEPGAGLSVKERAWLHGLLRGHASLGGAVLFTTDDAKEAAGHADRVVSIASGRLVADQDAVDFARTRLRPRVAVRTPHAARLADVLTREARAAQRAVEIVEESGSRLSVYGSDCAEIGEAAFRHGVLVHQLADETGQTGDTGDTGGLGIGVGIVGDSAAPVPPVPQARTRAGAQLRSDQRPELRSGTGPWTGSDIRSETRAEARADVRLEVGARIRAGGGFETATGATRADTRPDVDPGGQGAPRSSSHAGPRHDNGPGGGVDSRPEGFAGAHVDADPAREATGAARSAADRPETAGSETAAAETAGSGATGPDAAHPEVARRDGSRDPLSRAEATRFAVRPSDDVRPDVPRTEQPSSGATHFGAARADAAYPGAARPRCADPGRATSGVRRVGGPLRPLRYELRRILGTATPLLTAAAVVVASTLISLVLARAGHTPQSRLLAAWPELLPLPPAALGAGLLGALAFGEEYRYPALAADRGTVPRRMGLLTAKLGVCGAFALLLGALAVIADAAVLRIVFETSPLRPPAEWISPAASWAGLLVGCAWAGVLASGVFRSATAGLAAVLAVPVMVVPLVRRVLEGPSAYPVGGLGSRIRSLSWGQWPPEADRFVLGALRVMAQPVGIALVLSLMVLLCAYGFTGLRARVRW
ncbi:ATP-binding cassette domain-containing protein [Streptomyces sp. NPDC057939]|uniref:ATP-binding cassette domain-containing protein n=1 Tax=Streptomyces sp. NPDC057939 TaxID=3346284 RepID=UPI0036E31ADC